MEKEEKEEEAKPRTEEGGEDASRGEDKGEGEREREGEPSKEAKQVAKRGRGRPPKAGGAGTKSAAAEKPKPKSKGKGKDKQKHADEEKQPNEPKGGEEGTEPRESGETPACQTKPEEGEKKPVKKEEQEFFDEPDYVDINALWTAIRDHWQK